VNEERYLIYSREHNAWWRAHERGYTREIDLAGSYSKARAEEICAAANFRADEIQEFMHIAPDFEASVEDTWKLREALAESLKLQSHYAALLNQYDGGERRQFSGVGAWLDRLEQVNQAR